MSQFRVANQDATEWLPVSVVPGYDVSNQGKVRSWLRRGGGRRLSPRILKGQNHDGYRLVTLGRQGGQTKHYVHVLVLTAFRGPSPAGTQGSHLNGRRDDARLENLRWETPKRNNARKAEHGTEQRGEKNPRATLTDADARVISDAPRGYGTGRALARRFGVSEGVVSRIRTGRTWRHV